MAKKCICVDLPSDSSRKDEPLDVNLRLFIPDNHPSASPFAIFSIYTLSRAAEMDAWDERWKIKIIYSIRDAQKWKPRASQQM